MTGQKKKELLRDEVMAYLAERHPLKFDEGQLYRQVAAKLYATEDELRSAIAFRAGLGHAVETVHGSGATKYYAATAEGILAHERGQ